MSFFPLNNKVLLFNIWLSGNSVTINIITTKKMVPKLRKSLLFGPYKNPAIKIINRIEIPVMLNVQTNAANVRKSNKIEEIWYLLFQNLMINIGIKTIARYVAKVEGSSENPVARNGDTYLLGFIRSLTLKTITPANSRLNAPQRMFSIAKIKGGIDPIMIYLEIFLSERLLKDFRSTKNNEKPAKSASI